MKKVFDTLAILMLLGAANAHAISLEFVPAAQSVSLGSNAEVGIKISGLVNLAAPSLGVFDLDVSFNPAVLSFTGVTYGTLR